MTFRILVLMALCTAVPGGAKGQSISSPYSINGIGEIVFDGLPNNFAMGEVGIGSPTLWHINMQNPANLIYNNFSSFQVGIQGDFRTYESASDSYSESTAALRYLAMSFPIIKGKWTAAFSLTPRTSVNYNTFSVDSLRSATRVTQNQGDGGLTQLSWRNGFRIYKSLAIGVEASYIFGEITRESRDRLSGEDVNALYAISYSEISSYSDFNFSAALSYRWNLNDRRYMNFGATYGLSREISGTQDIFFERLSLAGRPIQQIPIAEEEHIAFSLPKSYGFGISYEKLNSLQIGVDAVLQEWESASSELPGSLYRNTLNVGAGIGWTPDYQSVNNYLSRATYRLGFKMKQIPYLVNDEEINDFGINFGASFPVSGYSSMDVAFKYGFRGSTLNNLIKENYFQVVLGATINDNQWFIKRRYD